jgi:hypothetical protein
MKLGFVLAFSVALLLLAASASASDITRSLPKTVVAPGETITVALNVVISNMEWYLVDEIVPGGFVASNPTGDGEGSTADTGHVKYAVLMNSRSTQLTYDLTAPQESGTYNFAGVFGIQGVDGLLDIGGQTQITVSDAADSAALTVMMVVTVLIIIVVLILLYLHATKRL